MRKILSLLLLLMLVAPVTAQVSSAEEIELSPFIVEGLDIQGVYPSTWTAQENAPGVFVRAADPFDLTAIIMQSREGTADSLLQEVLTSFGVEDELESQTTIESDFFTWNIYQFEREQGSATLIVDVAIAEDNDNERVYYILMQTVSAFYDTLHNSIFLPAVDYVGPIQRYEQVDELFNVPIPATWSLSESDDFATLSNPDETVYIHLMAIEADDPLAAMLDFWRMLDPEFELSYEDGENALRIIDDSRRIGDIDAVYIVDWADGSGEEGTILQSVARVYDGIVYMTLIESDLDSIADNDDALSMIDANFIITALEAIAESTPEA